MQATCSRDTIISAIFVQDNGESGLWGHSSSVRRVRSNNLSSGSTIDTGAQPAGEYFLIGPLREENAGWVAVARTIVALYLSTSRDKEASDGTAKEIGNVWISSKRITLPARLCSFRQAEGRFEKRDSKNWTLVVIIRGASQFSASNLMVAILSSSASMVLEVSFPVFRIPVKLWCSRMNFIISSELYFP